MLSGNWRKISLNSDVVVKDQINEEILCLGANAVLTGDEREAFAKFEHEGLEFSDDCLFEFRLAKLVCVRHSEKLQDVGVFDEILRLRR